MSKLDTLFLALEEKDFTTAADLIDADPSLLLQRFRGKLTALEFFCMASNVDVVTWLCEKLTSLNMSVDILNNDKSSVPIQLAYKSGAAQITQILAKYSDVNDLRAWFVQRQLICILGANFLYQNGFYLDANQARAAEGGLADESTHLICSVISELAKTSKRYAEMENDILNYYENTCHRQNHKQLLAQILERVEHKNKPRVIFNSGHIKHAFTVSVKQQENNTYELSFYDGNTPEFSFHPVTAVRGWVTGENAVVRRIDIAKDNLAAVLGRLIADKDKSADVVYGFIDSLPALTGNAFQYDQTILVDNNKLEKSRCYWENPKHAIMDLFIDKFGMEAGIEEFNQFLKFINIKLLENFKSTCQNQYDEQAIENLEKVVHKTEFVTKPRHYATKAAAYIATALAAFTILTLYAVAAALAFTTTVATLGPVGFVATPVIALALLCHEEIASFISGVALAVRGLFSHKSLVKPATSTAKIHSELHQPLITGSDNINSALLASTAPLNPGQKSTAANHARFKFAAPKPKSLTMEADLSELWPLPMAATLVRLQS